MNHPCTKSSVSGLHTKTFDPIPVSARFVPQLHFKFPKTGNRSCRQDWFTTYTWLHYLKEKDCVLCFACHQAREQGLKKSGRNYEETFVTVGFRNWKKAHEKFRIHEAGDQHQESIEFLLNRRKGSNVVSALSDQLKAQQQDARTAMLTIISSIRYLARSGQAIRGMTAERGNLIQLLEERALDVPVLRSWLQKRDKWLSGDVQNEILQIMSHMLHRDLLKEIKTSPFFAVVADGTTDLTGKEQFCLCVRYVSAATLQVREAFMDITNPPDGTAKALFETITTTLLALGLDIENLRGHCFDGAAVMAGSISGVQKRISDIQPRSLFVHCSNHALDLTLQEVARKCDLVCEALCLVRIVSNVILESAKRKATYANIVVKPCPQNEDDKSEAPTNILTLCPTRWSVRCRALERFLENHDRVRRTLDAILEDRASKITEERRAMLRGYSKKMQKFETLLGLHVSLQLFRPCEELARALQSPRYTATGAKMSAKVLWETLDKMGSQDFDVMWERTLAKSEELELQMPQPKREKQFPKRFEHAPNAAPACQLYVKAKMRSDFISVLDLLKVEISRRFDQPGMEQLLRLESILLSNYKMGCRKEELIEALGPHGADFDIERLAAQLLLFPAAINTSGLGFPENVRDVADILKDLPPTSRKLLDQMERLVLLLLTVPATSATAERSFSALRRLKTCLRSRMTQKRLTHLLLLHIHEERAKSICIETVLKEFVSVTTERRKVFDTVPK